MSDQVLELENVTKRFGDFTAVHGAAFRPAGSIYGFLGQTAPARRRRSA